MSEERKPKPIEKIIRVAMNGNQEQFKSLGDQQQRGEVKWMYYAIDGDKGYHHYLLTK